MRERQTGAGQESITVDRRALIAGGAALFALPATATPQFDIRVSADGEPGNVRTLAEALGRARAANGAPVRIGVAPGIYREKLRIDVPNVTIAGTGPGATIAFATGAQQPSRAGSNWGTTGSATVTVAAPGTSLFDLTIRNDHDYRAAPMQAVALAVLREGERTTIARCRIESWQDTLLLQATTLVSRCRVAGNIDFIFGGGAAWIEGCEIVSRAVAGAAGGGFVAAPSTPAVQPYGLVFADCRLVREAGVPDGAVFLGRPWRAGGNMALTGHAAFLRCRMDRHIAREGWTWMGFRDPQGVQRQLQPLEARLFEWRSRGPGAAGAASRRQLTNAAASAMTPVSVLGPWIAAKSDRRANGRGR